MVQQPVEQGRGQHLVGKDVGPAAVALVAGQDDGFLGLVAAADDLKQECCIYPIQGQIADLVQQYRSGRVSVLPTTCRRLRSRAVRERSTKSCSVIE